MTSILTVENYTPRSVVVRGKDEDATRRRKDELRKLGGRYNPRLRMDDGRCPGWIFSRKDYDRVKEYVDQVNVALIFPPFTSDTVDEINHKNRLRRTIDPALFDKECRGDLTCPPPKKRRIVPVTSVESQTIQRAGGVGSVGNWCTWLAWIYSLILTMFLLYQNRDAIMSIRSLDWSITVSPRWKTTISALLQDSGITNSIY